MSIIKRPISKVVCGVLTSLALLPMSSIASDIDNVGSLSQGLFKDLTSDLGAALSYKAIRPAEPMGSLGFDIGFEVTSTKLESNALEQATTGNAPSRLVVPKLHLSKGLPFGFDVGAFYTSVPDSNIGLVGGELSYALFEGGVVSPAISLRGTFSRLTGVNELDLSTKGLELSVSKGFAFFTPYAGIGQVWIDSSTNANSVLTDESLTKNKYFLGFNLNLGLMNIAAETEQTGDNTSTSAKVGVRF